MMGVCSVHIWSNNTVLEDSLIICQSLCHVITGMNSDSDPNPKLWSSLTMTCSPFFFP